MSERVLTGSHGARSLALGSRVRLCCQTSCGNNQRELLSGLLKMLKRGAV